MRSGSIRRVIFGALEKPSLKAITDLDRARGRDPRAADRADHLFGVYPGPVLDAFAALPTRSSGAQAALSAAALQRSP